MLRIIGSVGLFCFFIDQAMAVKVMGADDDTELQAIVRALVPKAQEKLPEDWKPESTKYNVSITDNVDGSLDTRGGDTLSEMQAFILGLSLHQNISSPIIQNEIAEKLEDENKDYEISVKRLPDSKVEYKQQIHDIYPGTQYIHFYYIKEVILDKNKKQG